MPYTTIRNKLKEINQTQIRSWAEEYVNSNKSNILKLVKERMLKGENVNSTGKPIGVYKSKDYSLFKERLNPFAHGTVDLFLEGDFQRFMTIEKKNVNTFKIYSKDDKYKQLGNKYGFEQFGLTEEQQEELQEEILFYVYSKIIEILLK